MASIFISIRLRQIPLHRAEAAVDIEFAEDVVAVGEDGVGGDAEGAGDFFVGAFEAHVVENLSFPAGEGREALRAGGGGFGRSGGGEGEEVLGDAAEDGEHFGGDIQGGAEGLFEEEVEDTLPVAEGGFHGRASLLGADLAFPPWAKKYGVRLIGRRGRKALNRRP